MMSKLRRLGPYVLLVFLSACFSGIDDPEPASPYDYLFEATDVWIAEGTTDLPVRLRGRMLGYPDEMDLSWHWLAADSTDVVARPWPTFGHSSTEAVYLSAREDRVTEPEETALLSLGRGSRPNHGRDEDLTLRVHVIDRYPVRPASSITLLFGEGRTWQYSVGSTTESDGVVRGRDDDTGECVARPHVVWREMTFDRVQGGPLGTFLYRQEGPKLYGMFASDTTSNSILSPAIHRSLPWLIADFAASPGDSWLLVEADSSEVPGGCSECEERIEARVSVGQPERFGSLAGAFDDVRRFELEVKRYDGPMQRRRDDRFSLFFADSLGLVKALTSFDDNCFWPGCPDWSGGSSWFLRAVSEPRPSAR